MMVLGKFAKIMTLDQAYYYWETSAFGKLYVNNFGAYCEELKKLGWRIV